MSETAGLRVSQTLELPIDAAAARFVALGKSGSGKTNAGVVFAEELLAHGVTTAILDVLGNMHGLHAAGTGPGIPIAILGGRNGDVPLRADRGAVVADLIASGVSAVIDLSEFAREDAQTFAADFFARLVPAVDRSRRNVHVIVEEAETFAPQTLTSKAQATARTAATVFARVARNVGIGWTFSTQRPQLLAKDVIDSSTAFIAMRMTGDLAQAAIGAEVRSRIGKTLERSIIADLPKLGRGEAWLVPDPDWLGDDREAQPVKFQFRWRHTFDSARPPKVGERREEPKQIADVDLEGLREAMAEDEPDVDDGPTAVLEPEEAKRRGTRIAELEAEVEAVTAQRDLLRKFGLVMALEFRLISQKADAVLTGIDAKTRELLVDGVDPVAPDQGAVQDDREDRSTGGATGEESPRQTRAAVAPARPARASLSTSASMTKGCRALLEELVARYPMRMTREQLAALTGRSTRSSIFVPTIRELLATGYAEEKNGLLSLTNAGKKLAGVGQRSSPQQMLETWLRVLPPSTSRMLRALKDAYPKMLSRPELAQRAHISITSSGFGKALAELGRNGLVHRTASDEYYVIDSLGK